MTLLRARTCVGIACWLIAASAAAAQQVATVQGVVREYGTEQPVAGARVTVVGTEIVALTDTLGRYELTVPAWQEHILRAHRPEYAAVLEQVRAGPGAVAIVDFTLAARALVLSALDIEGRPERKPDQAVAVIAEEELRGDAGSLAEVLDGVSGVELIRTGGEVGRGYRLRIRGAKSFTFSGTPVVYVDGVRVDVLGVQGGAGILELLRPTEVGRVELVRGAAAAARYGSGAMNGVILITTKRRAATPPNS